MKDQIQPTEQECSQKVQIHFQTVYTYIPKYRTGRDEDMPEEHPENVSADNTEASRIIKAGMRFLSAFMHPNLLRYTFMRISCKISRCAERETEFFRIYLES